MTRQLFVNQKKGIAIKASTMLLALILLASVFLEPYSNASRDPAPALEKRVVMVWISATGKKYHKINNCGNMNPKRARKITLAQAKKSYKPCSNCRPPK